MLGGIFWVEYFGWNILGGIDGMEYFGWRNKIRWVIRRIMFRRELNSREVDMLRMIRGTTFYDIVEEVRRDVDTSRYSARKELKHLRNQ